MNDNEIKARLFALYWGQRILYAPLSSFGELPWVVDGAMKLDNKHLLLRPLSSLTDEEITRLVAISGLMLNPIDIPQVRLELKEVDFNSSFDDDLTVVQAIHWIDYLRSIGVAMPFMGHDVEEQVEKGWIKIREEETK